jgi:putative DNA primase/helicase
LPGNSAGFLSAYNQPGLDTYRSGRYAGIGFAFAANDGLCGIDLDHVIDTETGLIEAWALEVLEHFRGAYIERSPSGTGLRIFCRGKPLRCGKGTAEKRIEVYDHTSPRYLTVTGHRYG